MTTTKQLIQDWADTYFNSRPVHNCPYKDEPEGDRFFNHWLYCMNPGWAYELRHWPS